MIRAALAGAPHKNYTIFEGAVQVMRSGGREGACVEHPVENYCTAPEGTLYLYCAGGNVDLLGIFRGLEDALGRGLGAVTATVVETRGSTPRKAGSKMLITSDGEVAGTIGGGCAESQVFSQGRALMEEVSPRVLTVDLTLSPDSGSEMICGGWMKVLAEPWRGADREIAACARDALEKRVPCALVTRISDGAPSRSVVTDGDEAAQVLAREAPLFRESPGELLFVEPLLPALSLVIAGAGHIAQPLATLAKMLGFHVTVIDDRDVFANAQRFPGAARVIVGAFGETLKSLPIDGRTFIVLLTRGHDFDEECLEATLGRNAAYLGMIGSRRRVKAVKERLRRRGLGEDLFTDLYAPIGLDLKAETPGEIALSIAAELEMIKRGGTAQHLSRMDRGGK